MGHKRSPRDGGVLKPRIRASSVPRVLSCNGSERLIPLVPKPGSGADAEEGTALHYMAHSRAAREFGAVGDLGPQPPIPHSIEFNKWVADYYVDTLAVEFPRTWSWEMEAELEWEFDRFILTAHPDDFAMSPDGSEGIGADFKAGRIPVEHAETNWQFFSYAVLEKLHYPSLRKITWLGVQPFNDEDAGFQRVTRTTLEGDTLESAAAYLENEINKALDNYMELNTGTQCKYCPVSKSLQCPAHLALREHMKYHMTEADVAKIAASPNDATLGDWVLDAMTIEGPAKAAKELAKERIKARGYIDAGCGARLTIKTTKGSISVPDKVAFRRVVEQVLPERERQDRCIEWSKGKIIDEIAEARNIPKKSKGDVSAESVYVTHLEGLTQQGVREIIQVEGA